MSLNRPVVLSLLGLAVALAAVGLALSLSAEDERRLEILPQPMTPAAQPAPERHMVMVEVVRIGEKGDTVIAGRAAPMANVQIDLAGQSIGVVLADSRGEWVFVPTAPIPEGLQVLSLTDKAGGPPSRIVTLISRTHGAAARAILIPALGRLRVLSGADRPDFAALAIDRAPSGALTLVGRAEPGNTIQAWSGPRQIARTVADPDGDWLLDLPNIAPSQVRLGIVDSRGKSQARLELQMPPPGQAGAPQSVTAIGSYGWRVTFSDGRVVELIGEREAP